MIKKIFAIAILFVLVISNFVFVFGEDNSKIISSATYNIFTNKLNLNMEIQNNPGIVGLKLLVSYDNLFHINKIIDNDILHGPLYSVLEKDMVLNPYTLMWCDFTGTQELIDNTNNGKFVSIEFDFDNLDSNEHQFEIELDSQSTINAYDELIYFDTTNCSFEFPEYSIVATYDENGKMTGIREVGFGDEMLSDEENSFDYKVFNLSSTDYPTSDYIEKQDNIL